MWLRHTSHGNIKLWQKRGSGGAIPRETPKSFTVVKKGIASRQGTTRSENARAQARKPTNTRRAPARIGSAQGHVCQRQAAELPQARCSRLHRLAITRTAKVMPVPTRTPPPLRSSPLPISPPSERGPTPRLLLPGNDRSPRAPTPAYHHRRVSGFPPRAWDGLGSRWAQT